MNEPDIPTATIEEVTLVQALYSIAQESEEPEIIRLAYDTLTRTQIGRNYLVAVRDRGN